MLNIDTDQYEWSTWSRWKSCSAACGGGYRSQVRYKLPPYNQSEGAAYVPQRRWKPELCNIDTCPWENSMYQLEIDLHLLHYKSMFQL